MKGKSKCKILKDIRRQIAKDNGITFVTSECKYRGDCTGTCPKCEAEVRYLESELEKRQKAGKTVAIAGIAAAAIVSTAGCGLDDLLPSNGVDGDVAPPESSELSAESKWEFMGEEPLPSDDSSEEAIIGEATSPDEGSDDIPMGDVAESE